MRRAICVLILALATSSAIAAQTASPGRPDQQSNYFPQTDPVQNISQETAKIYKAVQNLNANIRELLEKFAVGKGMQLTDRCCSVLKS